MTSRIIERAKVDEKGTIQGLSGHEGEDVYVVRAPKVGNGKNKEVVEDVLRFVKEHRSLAEKQYREFTDRYGRPQDKIKELAGHLTPEELAKRTKELREYAEKRVGEVRKEVEATYAKLEREIEQRAESVLKSGRSESKTGGPTVVLDEQAAAGSVENRSDREREF